MKKILMILGGSFIVLILIAITLVIFIASSGSDLDNDSRNYIDKVVPAICSEWNIDTLVYYSVPEMKEVSKKPGFDKLFLSFREKLGQMLEYEDSKGESNVKYIVGEGKTISAYYESKIKCMNDSATIKVTLLKRDNDWRIYNFKVVSNALICVTDGNDSI